MRSRAALTGLVMVLLEITGRSLPVLFPITPLASWINLTVACG